MRTPTALVPSSWPRPIPHRRGRAVSHGGGVRGGSSQDAPSHPRQGYHPVILCGYPPVRPARRPGRAPTNEAERDPDESLPRQRPRHRVQPLRGPPRPGPVRVRTVRGCRRGDRAGPARRGRRDGRGAAWATPTSPATATRCASTRRPTPPPRRGHQALVPHDVGRRVVAPLGRQRHRRDGRAALGAVGGRRDDPRRQRPGLHVHGRPELRLGGLPQRHRAAEALGPAHGRPRVGRHHGAHRARRGLRRGRRPHQGP